MTTEDRLRNALAAIAELVPPEEQPEQRTAAVRVTAPCPALWPARGGRRDPADRLGGCDGQARSGAAPDPFGGGDSARYFIANVLGGDNINELTVRDVRTGQVTATQKPPAGGGWAHLSAAADPNVFYVVYEHQDLASLYRLRIDQGGRIRALTRMRDLPSSGVQAGWLAVSPDGRASPSRSTRTIGRTVPPGSTS